ncbi:MAG: glycoside hydrolase family 5 protein [Ruminiclostridium sp.]
MDIKKIVAAFLAAVLVISGCGVSDKEAFTSAEEKPVQEDYRGFTVSGNMLLDANGNEFVMRGINHAHTWFKNDTKTAVPAIAETGANTVRIVLSNGYQWQKDTVHEVVDVVELCKENKLVTILEVHDGTGKDDPAVLDEIADYWIEIKEALIGNEDSVILNIANEWYGQWGGKEWAQAYVSVIPKIREAGIKNTILVDSAGWGQYGQSVADYGKQIFEADELRNTMFSIHMYGSAGGSKAKIKKNIDGALDKGLCLIIGEFGYNHSDGDVDEQYIMDYCTEKKVGYLGWSWKGNSGGVEYLDIAKDWEGSVLSADWGEILINGKNGIKETSEICSIFKE